MNYYIDFDNTLYNTPLLVKQMINSIISSACFQKNLDNKLLINECNELFSKKEVNTIYDLVDIISSKYLLDKEPILNNLNTVIINGKDFVFKDSITFLKKLHKDNKIYLLTHAIYNIEYQTTKVLGSGIANLFDGLYISSIPKYNLNIDYSNGIFIDDNPEVLSGLYSKNPKKLIRLRRKENKYSSVDLDFKIDEFTNFDEIKIDERK